MSDVMHTPGPWPIERNSRGTSIVSIGPILAQEYAGASWLEVSEEDALVASAAPELLEALQLFIRFYEDPAGCTAEIASDPEKFRVFMTTVKSREKELIEKSRAAIAKATGAA